MLSPPSRFGWITILLAALVAPKSTPRATPRAKSIRISSGQTIQLRGKLEVKFHGFFTYLVLETGSTYIADGGADEGTKRVRLIELGRGGKFSELPKHAGETVRTKGKLFIEFAAPYPYNGVQIEDASVQLADGTLVQENPDDAHYVPPTLPAALHRYLFTRTMVPRSLANPPDQWVNLQTGETLQGKSPSYCHLNASQDFMTCFCADGFSPLRGGLMRDPLPAREWQRIPKPEGVWKEMRAAQFGVPEGATHPIHIQLVCQRDANQRAQATP